MPGLIYYTIRPSLYSDLLSGLRNWPLNYVMIYISIQTLIQKQNSLKVFVNVKNATINWSMMLRIVTLHETQHPSYNFHLNYGFMQRF